VGVESYPSTTQVTNALPQRRHGGDFEDMDAAYNSSDGRGVSRPAYLAPCIVFPEVHRSFSDLQMLWLYLHAAQCGCGRSAGITVHAHLLIRPPRPSFQT
jgi:hypothetical protein